MGSVNWTGKSGTSDWTDANNWDPEVPQIGDDITISSSESGYYPDAPAGFSAGKFTVGDGCQIGGGPISVGDTFTCSNAWLGSSIDIQADGTIAASPGTNPNWSGNVAIMRGATITISGTVTISGGGIIALCEGSILEIDGSLTVTGETDFYHGDGAFPTILNKGQLDFENAGTSSLTGGALTLELQGGQLTIGSGTLLIGQGGFMSLAGGAIAGSGTLIVGDGVGGTLQLYQGDVAVPKETTIEFASGGTLDPDAANLFTLATDGMLRLNGGTIGGRVHITKNGRFSFETGVLESTLQNDGVATFAPASATASAALGGGGRIANNGRLTLNPGNLYMSFGAGGYIDNAGLLEVIGPGETDLTEIVVTSTGSVAVRAGDLSLKSGATLTLTAGTAYLLGGTIDGDGTLVLAGGSLTGQGTVNCAVQNTGGWLEPSGSGLTVASYTQTDNGMLVIDAAFWKTLDSPLTVTGAATLGGSIWIDARSGAPAVGTPTTLVACSQITGQFVRVRAPIDEQRLTLDTTAGISGTLKAEQLFYGFDLSGYPQDVAGRSGDSLLQQLHEDALLSSAGLYLAPSPNHHDAGWQTKHSILRSQGWGVLPVFVGRQQQNEGTSNYALIDQTSASNATTQGSTDGAQAIAAAGTYKLEAGAVIFLDIESSVVLSAQTLAYVDAWITAVQNGGYAAGLYCSDLPQAGTPQVVDQLHNAYPALPIWLTRSYYSNPLDANGDVRDITFTVPDGANPNDRWGFLAYAQSWQFIINWTGTLVLYDVTGARNDLAIAAGNPAPSIDFDVSNAYDPSGITQGPKSAQRCLVTGLTVDQATLTGGQQTTAHVQLNKAAPQPDGVAVLFRSSAPEAIAGGIVIVPAGQQTATFTVSSVLMTTAVSATLSARTMHQLSGNPVQTNVSISASS